METVAALATDLGKMTETSIKPMLALINQNITPAMADMRSTIERINRTAGRVDSLFSEENVKHWGRLLQNADGASANALKLSTDLSSVRNEVEGLVKDSRAIVSGSGKDLKESLRRVDATLYQLESAGRNLNEFSRTIRENPAALINSRPPADVEGAPQ
jgi:methyl-accepting chemotaxis protein